MDLKEILKAQGLSDDQINKILSAMTTNKLYTTTEENADIRLAKFKLQKEQAETDLIEANKTIETIKKGNKDIEALQTKITEYETKVAETEKLRLKEKKDFILKGAIAEAGGLDIDYLIYKLGDLEQDKDGNIPDLENKIKDLKANNINQFKAEDDPTATPPKGYVPVVNKLPGGQAIKTFTVEEVKSMTTEEINKNWDVIKNIDLSK